MLATFATSLYDERGAGAADFGLADVFGVSFGGRIDGPMQNSYLSLDADPATGQRHPILDGLDDTPRIINGVFRVARDADAATFPSPLTLIPTYPGSADGGRLSARARTPTRASSTCASSARSRVVYFPWDIDRTFWDVMCVDHGRLLRNADRVGAQRAAAGRGRRARACSTSPSGASASR